MSGADVAPEAVLALREMDRYDLAGAVVSLIEASRPFAALLQDHLEMDEHLNLRPAGRPVFAINDAIVTVGDLRAIRNALAACKGLAQ